jgi:predicted DNA-binding transcriptional regulator YafY
MGKAAMCIKIIEILNSRSLVKVSEIAALLGTNPRNVIEYKKELEEAGYIIDTVSGRNGGYVLNKKHLFPSVKLTDTEKEKLHEGLNYLLARNDFFYKNEISTAMSKIFSSIVYQNNNPSLTVINRFPLLMSTYELERRYFTINKAISNSNVIQVNYLSNKNIEKTYLLNPYKVFMFNNAWFTIAWNEKNGEIGYYKLNRINKIEVLNKKFVKSKTFYEQDYIDEFGMKNDGDFYFIKLRITGNYAAIVQERKYGKNQYIEIVNDKTTILSVSMQNKENIISFVLGFGKNCTVVEPEWLKNDIKKEVKRIVYNNK